MNSESKTVQYSHDFNRPSAIHYPLHPENDVHYTYGNANAGNNRVGRLVLQEDGSGAQEFQYGRQGELTKTLRTLIILPLIVACNKMMDNRWA